MVSQVEFEKDNYGRFIPDGLLFSHDYKRLVVVEIKTQHSKVGEQQLKNYVEWLSLWFHGPVSGLEVCSIMHPFQQIEWELVPTPMVAFHLPFCIFAVSSRSLPRIKDGLGMGKPASASVVSTTGRVGCGVGRSVRNPVVVAAS
jgi:hypothetical protein